MVIHPKTRGFICTTAHPEGCAKQVQEQIVFSKAHGQINGPRRVLVIGASTGYGLACRIAATYCCSADTIGVFFEKPSSGNRTASAGWYNSVAFEKSAISDGHKAININGDAFSDDVKQQTIQAIKGEFDRGQVDLIIYSVAAPKRKDPRTRETYASVIKPIGDAFQGKTVDFHTGQVSQVTLQPATQEETRQTVSVMGGEDWLLWIKALSEAGVLADGAATIAFSYIGPEMTHAIYKNGTIGQAKADLEKKALEIDALLSPLNGKSFVAVNKALVTQASAAIPVVPLYISILFKIMKENGTHEDCIAQMVRLFTQRLYKNGLPVDWSTVPVDSDGRIRMDDWEMLPETQAAVLKIWDSIDSSSMEAMTDLEGYRSDFYRLFGFGIDGVDYDKDVSEF